MTNVAVLPGSRIVESNALVSADQRTIFGDGTAGNPICTSFLAAYADPTNGLLPIVGMPLRPTGAAFANGLKAATAPSSAVDTATAAQARALGLISEVLVSSATAGIVRVQSTGILTLLPEEWDIVAGISGGLAQSETYYVDAAGRLSALPPGSGYTIQCGMALSSISMLLSLPALPLPPA